MSAMHLKHQNMSEVFLGPKASLAAISRLISSFSKRGHEAFGHIVPPSLQNRIGGGDVPIDETLLVLSKALLSTRGEASGVAIAQDILSLYERCTKPEKTAFFAKLGEFLGPDRSTMEEAWGLYMAEGDRQLPLLSAAVEAPRQELFRRLNLAPGGTAALVRMRSDLLDVVRSGDPLPMLADADLNHVLQSWFNVGFLTMKRIDWSSPARLLESVIRFEAVHHINGWDDLRNRLDPPDRRCYAFFHPAMPKDLLIFVEVALTKGFANSVQDILHGDRTPLIAADADTANFYSISNCQAGLRGISFGHFLIKQVAIDLKRELPNLSRFATLSPLPGFMDWLYETHDDVTAKLTENWWQFESADELREWLTQRAADYLVNAKNSKGLPLDPVARFHLGNGARLERINWLADTSPKGMSESAGIMVNYLYELNAIEENHEAYAEKSAIAVAPKIHRIARIKRRPSKAQHFTEN